METEDVLPPSHLSAVDTAFAANTGQYMITQHGDGFAADSHRLPSSPSLCENSIAQGGIFVKKGGRKIDPADRESGLRDCFVYIHISYAAAPVSVRVKRRRKPSSRSRAFASAKPKSMFFASWQSEERIRGASACLRT